MDKSITRYSSFYKLQGFGRSADKLTELLSTIDYRSGDRIPFSYFYDPKRDILRVPRGVGDKQLYRCVPQAKIEAGPTFPAHPINGRFDMKNEPLDYQTKTIDDFKEELLRKGSNQIVCDLPTGRGKTFVTLYVIAKVLKMKSVIFVKSMDTLGKQWVDSLFNHSKGFRYRAVQGSSMMVDLMNGADDSDIYIITHRTVASFIKQYGYEALIKFFLALGIGIKVYDEADLETKNMFRIDSHTSIKYNIYLTATHFKSSKNDNKAFQSSFKDVYKTGSKYFKEYKPNRNAQVEFLKIPFERKHYGLMYGFGGDFNKFKFAEILCGHDGITPTLGKWVKNEIKPTLKSKEMKMAFFVSSIKACYVLRRTLIDKHGTPPSAIGVYNSEVEDKFRAAAKRRPIIISTSQSLSRGVDIKGLKYVYNIADPHGSKSVFTQMIGRVGRYGGSEGEYREIVCTSVKEVFLMYMKRKHVFQDEFKKVSYNKKES